MGMDMDIGMVGVQTANNKHQPADDVQHFAYIHRKRILLYATGINVSSRKLIIYPGLQRVVQMFLAHRLVIVHYTGAELDGLNTTALDIEKLNSFPSSNDFNFHLVFCSKSSLMLKEEDLMLEHH